MIESIEDLPQIDPPGYGKPCNRCGKCCIMQLCVFGQGMFDRTEGPCPALVVSGKE